MSFLLSFHQPSFNYLTFSSQQQFFVGSTNPFTTFTMTPAPSAYNLMLSMQYYRPTMSLQVFGN